MTGVKLTLEGVNNKLDSIQNKENPSCLGVLYAVV